MKSRPRPILKRVLGTVAGHVVIARQSGGLLIVHPDNLFQRPIKTLLHASDGDRSALRAEFPLHDPAVARSRGHVVLVNWEAAAIAVVAVARYLGEIHPIVLQALHLPSSRCPCGRFLRFTRRFDDGQI